MEFLKGLNLKFIEKFEIQDTVKVEFPLNLMENLAMESFQINHANLYDRPLLHWCWLCTKTTAN